MIYGPLFAAFMVGGVWGAGGQEDGKRWTWVRAGGDKKVGEICARVFSGNVGDCIPIKMSSLNLLLNC